MMKLMRRTVLIELPIPVSMCQPGMGFNGASQCFIEESEGALKVSISCVQSSVGTPGPSMP